MVVSYKVVSLGAMPTMQFGKPVQFSLGEKVGSQVRFTGNSKAYVGEFLAEYMARPVHIEITRLQAKTLRVTCTEIDCNGPSGISSSATLLVQGPGKFVLAGSARPFKAVAEWNADGSPLSKEDVLAHPFIVHIGRKPKSGKMTLSLYSFNELFHPNSQPSCYEPVELEKLWR